MKKEKRKKSTILLIILITISLSGCCMEVQDYNADGNANFEKLALPESTPTPVPSAPTTCEIYGDGLHLNLSMNVASFSTTGYTYQCSYSVVACNDHSVQFYIQLEDATHSKTYKLSNTIFVKNGTSITQSTNTIKSYNQYENCFLTITYPSGISGYKCTWDFVNSKSNCGPI